MINQHLKEDLLWTKEYNLFQILLLYILL